MTQALLVFSTASKVPEAEKIAEILVEERLVACVNLLPQIDSRYWWNDKIQSGQEVLMIMKTEKRRFNALATRIKELHSYETPEVLAIPVVAGSADYLRWLRQSTTTPKKRRQTRTAG